MRQILAAGTSFAPVIPRSARERMRAVRLDRAFSWLLLPLIIELLAWLPLNLTLSSGLDPGWESALEMAARAHLTFGTQVIFAYGPLGYLSNWDFGLGNFMWYGNLAVGAVLYAALVRYLLAFAVFHGARRMYGTPLGALIAVLVLRVSGGQLPDLPVLLIALVWALDAPIGSRTRMIAATLAAAAAAIEMLQKISIGFTATAMVALFILSVPHDRRRIVASALGAFLLTFLLLWLLLGQALNAIPAYLHLDEQVASGYAQAMQYPGNRWLLLGLALVAAVGIWGAWETSSGLGKRQRVGTVLIWLCFGFSNYKEGFIRNNETLFFAAGLSGMLAFRWRPGRRLPAALAIVAVAGFGLYAADTNANGIWQYVRYSLPRVDLSAERAVSDVADVLIPSRRAGLIAQGRATVIQSEGVPAATLALLRGHTVDVYPWELQIVWAYGLNWRPIPVLQSYAAYTPSLDRTDANFIDSSRAPARILLQDGSTSIDDRVLSYDEPETVVAMLCHYRLLLNAPTYGVLARIPDRCGAEREIETVRAGWDQTVSVPAPPNASSVVLVRISGVQVHGLESIRTLLAWASIRFIALNGGAPNRLVPATAGDGLPLRAAPGLDFPAPYSTTLDVTSLSVGKQGQSPTRSQDITYAFYALTVRPR